MKGRLGETQIPSSQILPALVITTSIDGEGGGNQLQAGRARAGQCLEEPLSIASNPETTSRSSEVMAFCRTRR